MIKCSATFLVKVEYVASEFALGLFDDRTYNSPEYAEEVVNTKAHWDAAFEAHKKSVTILKNSEETLPLTKEKLEGKKCISSFIIKIKKSRKHIWKMH